MESLSIHLGFHPDPTVKTVDSLAAAVPTPDGPTVQSSEDIYLAPEATYGLMDLSAFSKHLKDGATVTIHIASADDNSDDENTTAVKLPALQDVHNSILLAGLRSTSETRQNDGSRVLTATKQAPLSTTSLAAAPIRINLTDDVEMDMDDDLVDEDGLLNDDSLLAAPPAMSAVASKNANTTDDCAGREPCADCTCGRADAKNAAVDTADKKKVKSSSCGKCGLGDAFRCASCPYLGKPAFKPGEEHLVLDLQDDL